MMDEKTLESLQSAFEAAPSESLANVLLEHFLSRRDITSVRKYLSGGASLESNKLIELVDFLIEHQSWADLGACAVKLDVDTCLVLIAHLVEKNALDQAKIIYLEYKKSDARIRRDEYEHLFNIEASPVKLKVVEKVDMSEVIDLGRFRQQTTTFKDVVGLSDIKKQIHKKIILPFQKPSLFARFKKKVGGGVLLYGPPGCGKTLLARASAGECQASFFNVEISDVLDMYIGESEQKLHAIFEKARSEAPSVIFFDELEALAGKREHTRNASSSNTISQFLTELDGFANDNQGVLVLASTNVPWSIDSAFLRPGRFDRMFFVSPPDMEARQSIIKHHMNERPCESDIDYALLAKKTTGYSGADLENLVEMAADEAIEESIELEKDSLIRFEHFKQALTHSRSTTAEWLTTARNYARYANDGGRYNDVLDFIKKHGK